MRQDVVERRSAGLVESTMIRTASRNGSTPKCEQRDMMWPWMSEISTRSGPNRRLWNTHVHDANEAISTRSAGSDGRRRTACHRVQTSATAHFTPNYETTSSEWMMM